MSLRAVRRAPQLPAARNTCWPPTGPSSSAEELEENPFLQCLRRVGLGGDVGGDGPPHLQSKSMVRTRDFSKVPWVPACFCLCGTSFASPAIQNTPSSASEGLAPLPRVLMIDFDCVPWSRRNSAGLLASAPDSCPSPLCADAFAAADSRGIGDEQDMDEKAW